MQKTKDPYEKLLMLLAGAKAVNHVNDDEIVAALGISRTCLHNRRVSPEGFRLGEIRALTKVLNISPDDMRAALL